MNAAIVEQLITELVNMSPEERGEMYKRIEAATKAIDANNYLMPSAKWKNVTKQILDGKWNQADKCIGKLLTSRALIQAELDKNQNRCGKPRNTERDAEILLLRSKGKKVSAIARDMRMTENAVKKVLTRKGPKQI